MLSPIKKYLLLVLSVLLVLCASGCGTGHETGTKTAKPEKPKTAGTENNELVHRVQDTDAPIVYYTKAVNSQGLLKVYEALKQQPSGKVGVKLSFEAPGAAHLDPQMLKPLVDKVQGTFIDSNGFTSPRDTTAGNLQVAQEHGFTAVGPVDILYRT